MFREALRRVAIAQLLQPGEVSVVERPQRADRQPDTMDRQCVALAQGAELRVRSTAGTHVVLGVDLEESDRLRSRENVAKVRRFEADAGTGRQARSCEHWHGSGITCCNRSVGR